jgi:hypothetical protein
MADFEKGQTFLDHQAINHTGKPKAKYFISLSNANDFDDYVICFVMNTEHRFEKYAYNCNYNAHRFIIRPKTFSFIINNTSIMLNQEVVYSLKEIYEPHIKILDKADDLLVRQIKNCINWDYILPKHKKLILDSFKIHT